MTSKIQNFPGTSLTEDQFRRGEVLFNHDRLNGRYAWDTGIAIGSYLAGLREGVLIGSECSHCRKVVIPPRLVCEWCFQPMEDYVTLSDTGVVNTFSLCYVTWDVRRIAEPEIPAVIDIDGASPGHGILHKLGEVDPQAVYIGMQVQAIWKPSAERTGAITDILYFKRVT